MEGVFPHSGGKRASDAVNVRQGSLTEEQATQRECLVSVPKRSNFTRL